MSVCRVHVRACFWFVQCVPVCTGMVTCSQSAFVHCPAVGRSAHTVLRVLRVRRPLVWVSCVLGEVKVACEGY